MKNQIPELQSTINSEQSTVNVASPSTVHGSQSSFLVILLSILLLLSVTIAGFFAYQTQKLVKELQGIRNEGKVVSVATTEPTTEPIATDSAMIDTTNWKTYANAKYNFSFKYPMNWGILDEFGGDLMIAPIVDIENVSKTLKYNILDGGYDGGKQIISLLSIREGEVDLSPDQYWDVVKTLIQIDNKTFDKYVSTNIKSTPNGKFFKGDITTEILMPLKDNFVINFMLIDSKYDMIFNQILSTFKFTN